MDASRQGVAVDFGPKPSGWSINQLGPLLGNPIVLVYHDMPRYGAGAGDGDDGRADPAGPVRRRLLPRQPLARELATDHWGVGSGPATCWVIFESVIQCEYARILVP